MRSFYDSNGDGVGDLRGLIQKLDYINDGNPTSSRSLGASCIWLMPVAASPSYHGYDVSDYYRVEPAYGTNDDFKHLVAEAHRRGIAILVDMVLNHSSSEHPALSGGAPGYDVAVPRLVPIRTRAARKGPMGIRRVAQVSGSQRVLLRSLLDRHAGSGLSQSGGS